MVATNPALRDAMRNRNRLHFRIPFVIDAEAEGSLAILTIAVLIAALFVVFFL